MAFLALSATGYAQARCYILVNATGHAVIVNFQYPPGVIPTDGILKQVFPPDAKFTHCFPTYSGTANIATEDTSWEGGRPMVMGGVQGALPPGTYRMISMQHECPNFGGTWTVKTFNGRPISDLRPMRINQNGCSFTGTVVSADGLTHHTLVGRSGPDSASVQIARVTSNGCRTILYATYSLIADGELDVKATGSDGRCELPTSYTEDRHFAR